ncbi:diguanylate cyclase (GGDEF) domain-containing protein [Desulfonispora thiosulfatigenes DSM 11270]|uniref:Diguanylate cyclase (GGDEF) domain-containing protein n=1 Tax=Desulfonispora thiosulfatigenes DSM 11270 TaxID=656914 RepID=A0A1W1V4C6_DESTI|nr:EAL domain-containing protein [Desulfonispora thiosulfatigenes]SMB88249.1 diguanylate cyclase (GGDEF) domain-containing protein [Desulfonispora thiosulfatigenes DSM 11270]
MFKSIKSQLLINYFIIVLIAFMALAIVTDHKLQEFMDFTNGQYMERVCARAYGIEKRLERYSNPHEIPSPSAILNSFDNNLNGESLIINDNGLILARSNSTEENNEPQYITNNVEERAKFANQVKRIEKYKNEAGTKMVAFIEKIDGSPDWTYIYSISEYDLYSQINTVKYTLLLALAICFVFMSLFIYLFSNRITLPIIKLKEVFEEAADGNFHVKANESTPNEIGKAAQSFNRMIAKIKNLTYTDSITELHNFNWFLLDLPYKIERPREEEGLFALVIISIDDFKKINGVIGYEGGNEALRVFSNNLKEIMQDEEIIARYYGDEFILLLWASNRDELEKSIHNLWQKCSEKINIRGNSFKLKNSIGARIFSRHDKLISQKIIHQATLAKIMVKKQGGDNYIVYNQEIDNIIREEQKLEIELENALDEHEFYLLYQPVVDIATGKTQGVEALVRWNHKVYGKIPIITIIKTAEQSGLILDIGKWVLKEACQQNKKWQLEGYDPIIVSVNVSALQLDHPDFVELVKKILEETELEPKYLELEITETVAMENVTENLKKMKQLKEIGIGIAIDDFGTGYSSLAYLAELPIDKLKVDRSFIKDVPECADSMEIVNTIINLAKSMRIKVTAEGVETMHQHGLLSKTGCDLVQGYLISKPRESNYIEQKFLA